MRNGKRAAGAVGGGRCGVGALILLSSLLLTACGFHLRGAVELPEALEVTTVEGAAAGTLLGNAIRDTLESAGATVLPEADEESARLVVFGEEYSRRVLSVGSMGKAQEYELFYRLNYSVRGPDGRIWVPEQSVSLTRDYFYDAENVLSTEQEERQLREEMRQLGVRQMLRRVQVALRNGPPPTDGNAAATPGGDAATPNAEKTGAQ